MKTSKYLIGIGGKANSGKDLVGKIIQYLTAKYTSEEILDILSKDGDYLLLPFSDETNWKIKKFADKLKDIVCLLIGCTRQQLEDRNFKEKELGEEWGVWKVIRQDGTQFGRISANKKDAEFTLSICSFSNCQVVFEKMTPRKMLQQVGTDLFRNQLHPNTWTNATFANYKPIKDNLLDGEIRVVRNEDLIYPNWIITDVRFPNELEAIKKHNGITIRINRGLVERTGKLIQEPEHISETALDDAKFDYIIENDCTIDDLIEKVREILIKENIIND